MKTLIMKFGGASVATPDHFLRIANLILERRQEYQRIVVVVSAMGNTTDKLIELAKMVHPQPPCREQDMLVSVGERISMSLLAMALIRKNQSAVSFTGSQSGIITSTTHSEAKIIHVKPHRIVKDLERGKIVIVAGFQGVSREGEITTLGRGGSDTTAVALGVAIDAERVEFYKDVKGIYEEDPKKRPGSKLFDKLNYDAAIAIVSRGSGVLHERCLQLAKKNQIPLFVKSFLDSKEKEGGTLIMDPGGIRNCPAVFEEECEASVGCL